MKVLSAAEVAYWGRGPVVGTTRWPRQEKDLDALVAELDDYMPETAGQTLVVAASDKEKKRVAELACRLSEGWGSSIVDGGDLEDDERQVYVQQVDEAPDPEDDGGDGKGEPKKSYPVYAIVPSEPKSISGYDATFAEAFRVKGWMGEDKGPSLRRASRLSDRVLVVVTSGEMTAIELQKIATRLGRDKGVGFVVIGADDDIADLKDRVGDVESFWKSYRMLGPAGEPTRSRR
jgi:hypothetical protein